MEFPSNPLTQLTGSNGPVHALTYSSSPSTYIITGSADRNIRLVFLWDVQTAKTIRKFGGNNGHTSRVNSVVFGGSEESVLVSGGFDRSVRIWDIRAGNMKPVMVMEDAKDSVSVVLAGKGGDEGYGGGGVGNLGVIGNENVKGPDGEVIVWETLTGNVLHRVKVEGSKAEGKEKIGRDGKEKERTNVISAIAWKETGKGDQWCCAGTDGVVTVFGPS
ncbi:hypothetical protein DID88_002772 [Monilinia fructigena]|uniref:Uncharacterized protein n=1 Tax=Monilinia fructigena TaxID=38457 RepID=A0A395IPA6_9HELO|nr:hypothetical protein DID88_002772 [Monilinia fructigena]